MERNGSANSVSIKIGKPVFNEKFKGIEPKIEPNEYVWLSGYTQTRLTTFLYVIFCVCSFGVVWFVAAWHPRLKAKWSMKRCNVLPMAMFVLLKYADNEFALCKVHRLQNNFTYFEFRKYRYVYMDGTGCFELTRLTVNTTFGTIASLKNGLSNRECNLVRAMYGSNEIVVDQVSVSSMLMTKVSHPFYIFQVFSALVWFNQGYNSYAVIILCMSVCSIFWEIFSAKRNEANLCEIAKLEGTDSVMRDNSVELVDTRSLVPGDVVLLEGSVGNSLGCDMVLLSGEVVVDESTLTGESIPIVKQPIPFKDHPSVQFEPERHKHHALYGGSKVLQVRQQQGEKALAVVTATGFSSAKGELFRSVLFPKKIEFKFQQDAYRFLLMLSAVAVGAFVNRCIEGVRNGNSLFDVMVTSLDLITIAVPPALPLVLTAGVGFSLDRLRKLKIYCIDPQRISLAGRIDTMCWDKTGTLTADHVTFYAVQKAHNGSFSDFVETFSFCGKQVAIELAMVACHGLNSVNGKVTGHSVDLAMFGATEWTLESGAASNSDTEHENESESQSSESTLIQQPPFVVKLVPPASVASDKHITVTKRFDFDNHLQRSCVILQLNDSAKSTTVCAKGSPEAIRAVCDSATIPPHFEETFHKFSSEGYYILGCAARMLSNESEASAKREELEKDMEFLGFVLLQNPVKPQTCSVLRTLQRADIDNIIITGDNALTAVHVAHEVGLAPRTVFLVDLDEKDELVCHKIGLDPVQFSFADLHKRVVESPYCGRALAVRGVALDAIVSRYEDDFVDWFMENTLIFARIKPKQKTWIVERLIERGKRFVGMCGDGTNDCGALKAAHIGIALSDAEASIVAPLTSTRRDITDVVRVFCEGRCALATSFAAFKFMTLYPICQLMIAATLNHLGSTMSNNQYLFDDLVLVLVLGMLMLMTHPARKLGRERPTDSLFSPIILTSILGQVVLAMLAFSTVYIALHAQSWFCSSFEAALWNSLPGHFLFMSGTVFKYASDTECFALDPVKDLNNGLLVRSHENTVFWTFGHFMFLICAVAFSVGAGFRRPFWTNRLFFLCIIFYSFLLTFILFFGSDVSWIADLFQLVPGIPPMSFKWLVFGVLLIYASLSIGVWESIIVAKFVRKWATN